jgi:hypothetical protein
MKLWLISKDKNNGYDTYDSAVVAAETKAEAKLMNPSNGKNIDIKKPSPVWVGDPADVRCEYIGRSKKGTQKGVICASFNAG